MLDRPTIRVLERVMNTEAAELGTLAFPSVRWLVSTYIAARCILAGAFRRERALFEAAAILQNQVTKSAQKEQYSLKTNFFKVARTLTDPAWRLRISALLKQAKYEALVMALGPKQGEFVDALANAYTTWVTHLHNAPPKALEKPMSEEDLDAMCPEGSQLEDCEKRCGMWGSLFFQEPSLPLGKLIGRKRMVSPYLFKYWTLMEDASAAKLAIGDFEDLERYKHTMRRTHNVKVVGTLQASISVLLSKYNQVLQDEEAGVDIRSDHKLQVMKYFHLQMREILGEAKNPSGAVTVANLTSSLRAAGYDVLVRLPLRTGLSSLEENERFSVLEGMADMLYRDLQLPVRSMHLRTLYGFRLGLYESKVHLPFASKMMRSNPLSTHAGFQLSPKHLDIRSICKDGFCPHSAVIWNHVYVTLLVLSQLAERHDAVAELLAADSFSNVTGQEGSDLNFQQVSVLKHPPLFQLIPPICFIA